MKKIINKFRTFLFVFMLLNCMINSYSKDDYYPFPQTDAKWTVLHTNMFQNGFWETREYKTADTITIENTLYRLLAYSCLENHYYAFREENKQIFFYIPSIGEVLVYDFNLNVGDTIFYDVALYGDFRNADSKCKHCGDFEPVRAEYEDYEHYKVVESIDTVILADGSERKRFSLDCDTWIEGVGSTAGVLGPIAIIFALCGDVYNFTCLQVKQEIIYLTPKCTDCLCGKTCEPVENLLIEKCSDDCVLLSWAKSESALKVKKYTIYRNDEFLLATADTTYMDENLSIGEYEYYVVTHYDNGCVSDSSNHVAERIELGVKGVTEVKGVTVYPNPTTGELRIENGELRITDVDIFDVYGRNAGGKFPSNVLEGWQPQADGVVINLTVLKPGIYFVRVVFEGGSSVKKLVKL